MANVEIDHSGFEVLAEADCLSLLAGARVGRVALNVEALPTVVPVGFVLTPTGILFTTPSNSALVAATRDTVVAFEADGVGCGDDSTWSVVVVGVAGDATDLRPDEQAHIRSEIRVWNDPRADRFVRIRLEIVSGRRSPPIEPNGRADHLPAA